MQNIGLEPGVYPLSQSSGSNVPEPEISPSTSWDVEAIVNAGMFTLNDEQINNVRYGFTVNPEYTVKLAAGSEYYLSDDTYYDGSAEVIHTWDINYIVENSSDYVGVVIVCSDNRDVAFQHRKYSYDGVYTIDVYFGDCNLTKLVVNGNYQGANFANASINSIKCSKKTTAVSDLFANYVVVGTPVGGYQLAYTFLTHIDIPEGADIIGSSSISSLHYNTASQVNVTVKLPKSMVNVGSVLNSSRITNIIVAEGFNASLQSSYLSVPVMNNIITNYADRTGLDALTFTVGTEKLALLSADIKTLAADKNIILA